MPDPIQRPTLLQALGDSLAPPTRWPISARAVQSMTRGDGGPVLLLPGLLHGDAQMRHLRNGLTQLGYRNFGWELGPNYGPTPALMERAMGRLGDIARAHGPVRVVGYSLGGFFARWLAAARPRAVRQVITICCPFRDALGGYFVPLRGAASRIWPGVDAGALAFLVSRPPEMPWGAIYSPRDGIAAWQACMDPAAPALCAAVPVRHRTAPRDARVLAALAAMLAA